jgi:hypothetical protein
VHNRRGARALSVLAGAGLIVGLVVTGSAAGAVARHSPPVVSELCGPGASTFIGQPYACSYGVQDTDGLHDGVTVTAIQDDIGTASGAINSGNILSDLQLIFDPGVSNPSAMPSCVGGSGQGTTASPYIGATECTIPWDSEIETDNFTFYTVAAADFNLPGHRLSDTMTVTWQSLCASPGGSGISCPIGDQNSSVGGSTIVEQLTSQTTTTIRTSSESPVTSVVAGTSVHDAATVTATSGDPTPSATPTGTVSISWFTNGSCSGSAKATSGALSLNGSGQVDATSFSQTPTGAGQYSFKAIYNGDPGNATYTGSTGPCETLTVTNTQAITSGDHASASVGEAFTFEVTTSGAPVPVISEVGNLPKGIKLKDNGNGTATISGTAKKAGVSHVSIKATFGKGGTKTVVRQRFTLTVDAG